MSNLSLARIMYGSSEFSATSSMQPRPLRLRSSNLSFGASCIAWMTKNLPAVLQGRSDRSDLPRR